MNVNTELTAITHSKIVDIGSICEQINITLELEGNAGVMETSYIPHQTVELEEGDVVFLKVNDTKFFYGWVFRKEINAYGTTKLKIYDIKRYLAYKDVDVTGNETIDQFFTRICKVMKIKHKVIHKSSYIIPTKIHDGDTYNNMLQYAIDQTLIGTDGSQRFCVRANGDTLELVDCGQQQIDLIIGDKRLMTDYQFTTDIENTYTTFKVQREVGSEEQKKLNTVQQIILRKTLTDRNQENLDRWGDLQYYDKKDSKWTDAQLAEYLKHIKRVYGKQTKTLKINCLGDTRCVPGNMLVLDIEDLKGENVGNMKYALIVGATHTISHNIHTMELTMEVLEE